MMVRGNQTLIVTDRCLARIPDMKVKMLENIYGMISETYIELWEVYNAWMEIGKIHTRFCKKVLGIPRCAANGAAEIELSRESRREKIMSLTLKYWHGILRMDCHEVVKNCYVWQRDNIKFESWSKRVKEELEKIGLAFIWQNQGESYNDAICRVVKEKCNNTEKQNLFSRPSEKMSLVFIKT
jgi:hypothetical protein